jgi:hypothetical protein
LSTHYITRCNQTTRSADVFSIGENLSHPRTAEACLTGAARVYLDQSAPSIFGFVRNLRDKGSPRSIVYRLSQHATRQAFDVQVFDNYRSEILDQPEREPVLKFVPLIPDSSVNLLEQGDGLATTMRALLGPSLFGRGENGLRLGHTNADGESLADREKPPDIRAQGQFRLRCQAAARAWLGIRPKSRRTTYRTRA